MAYSGCIRVRISYLVARVCWLLFENKHAETWELVPYLVPLLTVLVAVRVANRLISNSNIIREDERRHEIVRTTHHLIAIARDLRDRVDFVKSSFVEGGRSSFSIVQIANSIEDRYETLLQRDAYKYLPGTSVDIINSMSGHIFGILALVESVKIATTSSPDFAMIPLPKINEVENPNKFDELISLIQKLIDELFEVRLSIDVDGCQEKG